MKLNEIKTKNEYIAEAILDGISDSYTKFRELDQLNSGYAQLARLSNVFQSGDWGALIDQTGRLNKDDIGRIKVQLHDIIFNNPVLVGWHLGASADGYEKMRLFGEAVGHSLELALSAAITAVFASLTVGAAASGLFSWATGLNAAGTVGGAALTAQQVKYLEDLKSANDLMDIINAYDNIGSYKAVKRGLFRRFLDWAERKSPEDIQREMQMKARVASAQAEHHFDTLIEKLPKYVTYWDNGEAYQYPTVKLFELP